MIAALATLALAATSAVASPISLFARDNGNYKTGVTIHESCNATQKRELEAALSNTYELTKHAKEYIVKNGPNSDPFKLYFGTDPEAYSTVIGIYDSLLTSNKDGVLLRCDDIDGNCQFDGWAGHWRGDNATAETVICDLSYNSRKYNVAYCMNGFKLETDKPNKWYWSTDLMHRLYHVPQVTNGLVEHYAEDLQEVLELAAHNSSFAARDSNALQYFATHVYATEVAKGGDQCIGTIELGHTHSDNHSHDAAPSSSAAAGGATSAEAAAPAQTSAAQDCHTHANGELHCV